MMTAATGVQAAAVQVFCSRHFLKSPNQKEKESRNIYTMDGSVASAAPDGPTIYSSITDANGFTAVSRHGSKSSSPPKQQLQSRSPPLFKNWAARFNPFDEQFLNSFSMPGGPALDTDGMVP
jgi:hypothetical protein